MFTQAMQINWSLLCDAVNKHTHRQITQHRWSSVRSFLSHFLHELNQTLGRCFIGGFLHLGQPPSKKKKKKKLELGANVVCRDTYISLYISVNLLVSVCCFDPECGRMLGLNPLAPCNFHHQIQGSDLALMTDSGAVFSYRTTLPPLRSESESRLVVPSQ